jgi:GT2 family glycosyltransferase
MIPKFTFCITSKNNLRYLKYAVKYIQENCHRKDHNISVFIDSDNDGTTDWCKENNIDFKSNQSRELFGIGNAYNLLVENATTDFVVIYHADMIAGKNLDLNLYSNWKRGLVVSATRIEPPLHPSDPAKIVKDFGMWPEEDVTDGFKLNEFNKFVEENLKSDKITNGVFAPWLIHKDDFMSVGGHDPIMKSHSEDRDLFNRFLLNGFDFVQPWNALVYHLTCRGGQFEHAKKTNDLTTKSADWNKLAQRQTKEFIRKWGSNASYNEYQYPIVNSKYDIGCIINDVNLELINFIEPYFNNICVDNKHVSDSYINFEKNNTSFDLNKKFITNKNEIKNDIIIEFDGSKVTMQNVQFLIQLPMILKDSGEIGEMEYDIFNIKIKCLEEQQFKLINLK